MFGLYMRTSYYSWEGDSDRSTTLLATDDTIDNLVDRWNKEQKKECLNLAYKHKSYHNAIPPYFEEGSFELTFPGSTGGGYSSVMNLVYIKEVPQWDEE